MKLALNVGIRDLCSRVLMENRKIANLSTGEKKGNTQYQN